MASLSTLPAEIIQAVFSSADQASQKALRLTNRQLSRIGQRILFQTASVSPTDESCRRLESILERPDLASCIAKIYLNTFDVDGYPDHLFEWATAIANRLFKYLNKCPRLQSIVLRFHPQCVYYESHETDAYHEVIEDSDFHSGVMQVACSALAAVPNLKELALRDLQQSFEVEEYAVSELKKSLGGLRSLRLNLNSENLFLAVESPIIGHQKFDQLPSFWLRPTVSKLQHLTLFSDILCGFFPKLDFRGLHFPHLRTLALANYSFVHDSQLNWILEHGKTLTDLYLNECALFSEVAMGSNSISKTYLSAESFASVHCLPGYMYASYNTRWADYFRAFKERLPCLRHFRFAHGPEWYDGEFHRVPFEVEARIQMGFHQDSYLTYQEGVRPGPWVPHMRWPVRSETGDTHWTKTGRKVAPSEEDKGAFRELCAKLGQGLPEELVLNRRRGIEI